MDTTLSTERVEKVEHELNRLVERRASQRAAANLEACREREKDRRRVEALHAENKTLYVHHHFALAEACAKLSADHARRAEALLNNGQERK